MPEHAKASEFIVVAGFLVQDETADLAASQQLWEDCEDSRARSSISRTYYAVFRALKARLMKARVDWDRYPEQFPQNDVHRKLKESLEDHLGASSRLASTIRQLIRQRKAADYQFVPLSDGDFATSTLEAGQEALELIKSLSQDELEGIALALFTRDKQNLQSRPR
jgi:hypothetical protein